MRLYPTHILAHRGGGNLAPENTLAAMRCGLSHGFHAVEFDVMLSGDGVPMVNHDADLGRTIAGGGRFSSFTAQQLGAMDAGAWHSAEFAGEPVATYEQVWRFCTANNIWMNVEIKPVPGFERETGRLVAELSARLLAEAAATADEAQPSCGSDAADGTGAADRFAAVTRLPPPLFSSFSKDALIAARAVAPELLRACLVRAVPADWQSRLLEVGAVALHVRHDQLTPDIAYAVKMAGFGLLCYTINQPARARELLSWGVDALCTDRIDLIGSDFR